MANELNKGQLAIDIKTADRLREFFSKRNSNQSVNLTKVALGDSDIDYHLSNQTQNIKALNAPFQPTAIKHKLAYEGIIGNLTGFITCFVRKIDDAGNVYSTYAYPSSLAYSQGVLSPTLINGNDVAYINFDTTLVTQKEGAICFFQTLPSNYLDPITNEPLRLIEEYGITYNNVPVSYEIIYDKKHQSLLIAKPANYTFLNLTASITLKGELTGIIKTITFNI